jgi:hypothetical protein
MPSWEIVYAEIKAFDDRRAVVAAMRKGIRQPVPTLRKAIKNRARQSMPKRGGLNRWLASARVNATIKVGSRGVTMKLVGSKRGHDTKSIDAGRVRAPSWGRRGPGQWHTQTVPRDFFRGPAAAGTDHVIDAIDGAVDQALDTLRR